MVLPAQEQKIDNDIIAPGKNVLHLEREHKIED
jgi:hypothetical protein